MGFKFLTFLEALSHICMYSIFDETLVLIPARVNALVCTRMYCSVLENATIVRYVVVVFYFYITDQ